MAENNDKEGDLAVFLKALGKEKFYDKLLEGNVKSVSDIEEMDFDDLAKIIPKMVSRQLHKKAIETSELRLVLELKGKGLLIGPLVEKDITSLEKMTETPVEDMPISKIVARLIQKKAKEISESKDLFEFLRECNKGKYFDALMSIKIRSPEDIRDSSFEEISKAGIPKMVARVLYSRAVEKCAPDIPDFEVKLGDKAKDEIREIWDIIKLTQENFGERFYRYMLLLDHEANQLFSSFVNFDNLGHDFNRVVDRFIEALDHETQFNKLRDELVSRFMKYGMPVKTLRRAVDAFVKATVAVEPILYVTNDLASWRRFYSAMIPPLHPTMLKNSSVLTEEEWSEHRHDLYPGLKTEFLRKGSFYFASWMEDRGITDFTERLYDIIKSFSSWKISKGRWKDFEASTKAFLDGLQLNEKKVTLVIEIFHVLSEIIGDEAARKITDVLFTAIFSLFGQEFCATCINDSQRELIWFQWQRIFPRCADEFGTRFYQTFLKDPLIAEIFKGKGMAMQSRAFVEQLDAVFVRINEGDEAIVPLLRELGARHRVFYKVGSRAMDKMMEPMLLTIGEMLGVVDWTADIRDAWASVVSYVLLQIKVGWTLGTEMLHKPPNQQKDKKESTTVLLRYANLKQLLNSSEDKFRRFFDHFAEKIGAHGGSNAGSRYFDFVRSILRETSTPRLLDRVDTLGRRHQRHYVEDDNCFFAEVADTWMSKAIEVFGAEFNNEVIVEWAHLWGLLASAMVPQYSRMDHKYPTLVCLAEKYMTHTVKKRKPTLLGAAKQVILARRLMGIARDQKPTTLSLKSRTSYPGDIAYLQFELNRDVEQSAGQFCKLRFRLPNGTGPSKFYSIASCPDPSGTARELGFLIKEVKGGRVSPFLVHAVSSTDHIELVTIAGNFKFPTPLDGHKRIMASAGVGIVAFMSAIRFAAEAARGGRIKKKIHLALIHSERTPDFPFFEEIISVAKEFSGSPIFQFDFVYCCTGADADKVEKNIFFTLHNRRMCLEILQETHTKFDSQSVPLYGEFFVLQADGNCLKVHFSHLLCF